MYFESVHPELTQKRACSPRSKITLFAQICRNPLFLFINFFFLKLNSILMNYDVVVLSSSRLVDVWVFVRVRIAPDHSWPDEWATNAFGMMMITLISERPLINLPTSCPLLPPAAQPCRNCLQLLSPAPPSP